MHPHFYFLSNIPGIQNLTVGCVAGGTVMAITNPLWVAKTRLCLQYESEKKQYKNLFHCLSKILKDEGIRGWYKGFVPALFGTFNGAIQFAIYNALKSWKCKLQKLSENSQLVSFFFVTSNFFFCNFKFFFSVNDRLFGIFIFIKNIGNCINLSVSSYSSSTSGSSHKLFICSRSDCENCQIRRNLWIIQRHVDGHDKTATNGCGDLRRL